MRAFIVALTIGALTATAAAQGMSGGKKRQARGEPKNEQLLKKKKADDSAYKAALDKIPNQKYDPWQAIR